MHLDEVSSATYCKADHGWFGYRRALLFWCARLKVGDVERVVAYRHKAGEG